MDVRWLRSIGTMSVAWSVAAVGGADPVPATAPQAAAARAEETAAAERGPFEVVFEVKGGFEPVESVVIDGRPKSFTQPLEIVSVVPHGARVAAGDVILGLAADAVERAIADLVVDLAGGEKALEVARHELAALEATTPLELAAAERQERVAAENLVRFTTVGRGLFEEAARFSVVTAEQRLRSEREELVQLERMYKDKDLTEETEEMILQRTRFEVAAAEQFLKQTRASSEDALQMDIPRRAAEFERAARLAAIGLAKARATLPVELEQKRLGVAKLEHDRRQSLRKLEELRHDLALATVKAPRAGVVYHGRLQDGTWTTAAVAAKAIAGQAVPLGDLAFTVVGAGPLRFRAKVEEKDLHLVTAGLTGRVAPTGWPDARVAVTLEPGFVTVPKDGKCDAVFAADAPAGGPPLAAGMTGTARLVARSRPDAVTVPDAAVTREADGTAVVQFLSKDGTVQRRAVKAGMTSGGRTEILEGLAAGDRVRTTAP
mgnify:CR=1 FL=1